MLPERSRVYRNHHLDSARWDRIPLRGDDIVIATSLKTGTTWTQRIVSLLLFGPGPLPTSLNLVSPWIEARFVAPVEDLVGIVEAQTHRRFFKCHLPLDALPYDPRVKYVYVGRDGRDVFMSMVHHYASYNDAILERLNSGDGFEGESISRCPEDIHEVFAQWVGRGSFAWENDGYPFWSHLHHAQSFWKFRHLPNILFLHFADMKADLEREMRRVASFLGIDVLEDQWPALVKKATFEEMKKEAEDILPEIGMGFVGGARSFINKGTNNRWRDVLTREELAAYDDAVSRTLSPDCARWLERGSSAGDPKSM